MNLTPSEADLLRCLLIEQERRSQQASPGPIARAPDSYDRLRHSGDAEGAVQPSQIARDPFELVDEPSWHADSGDRTRHDDICPIKRARWEGVFVGIAIGIVLTMAAVALRSFGTLLP